MVKHEWSVSVVIAGVHLTAIVEQKFSQFRDKPGRCPTLGVDTLESPARYVRLELGIGRVHSVAVFYFVQQKQRNAVVFLQVSP